MIYLSSNFTRDTYAFDLSRSNLKDYQKNIEGEIVSHWALKPMKFSLNLMNCGVKTDSFPRRGHVYYNGEWIAMSKPCMRDMMKDTKIDRFHHQDGARPMKFGKIVGIQGQRIPAPPRKPSRGIIEIQEKKQIVMHNEQPKRRQRKHNLRQRFARVHAHLRRWGRKENNANVPQTNDNRPKFAHRHHARNHPGHSRHEIKNHGPQHDQKQPATTISPSYSIHTGFATLIQPNKRSQPMGFTLTYTAEKQVNAKLDGLYTLVAKVNVICQREGIKETGKMTLIDQSLNGRTFTSTWNYYSFAGCVKAQSQPTRHDEEDFEIIIAPVFLLVFCCSFCIQVIPIIAIFIAIIIAIKKIQEIRKKNAQIKTNATATVLPQVNMVPVPVKQVQPVEQPQQKKEERKPMQQVGVQVVQQQQQVQQQIELQPMVLPNFQPQTVQPQVPVQQQPRYAFYPPIQPQFYPQVFVYPQQ